MQNILKLTGVSMLAIMAATNANAAGYTCESLIQYESCNPGYYLSTTTSDNRCPEGHTISDEDLCWNVEYQEFQTGVSPEECMEECLYNKEELGHDIDCSVQGVDGYMFYEAGQACINEQVYDENVGMVVWDAVSGISGSISTQSQCNECPAGYSCEGGTAAAELCSGETYADETGLAACKSCRDAAGTIGVTNDMIESITGGTTCTYDVKITSNHAVIDGVTCRLDEYEPDNYCQFSGTSDEVKCDAGYYFPGGSPTGDCTEDYPGWYGCSDFYTTISDLSATFACSQVPVGNFSPAGSWNAYQCPSITDADGNVIATTTESAGATSASDCFVGSTVTFKDDKGEYKFRENCKYDNSQPDVSTPEKCIAAGWKYDSYRMDGNAYEWYEDYCEIDGNVDFSNEVSYQDGLCVDRYGSESAEGTTSFDGTKCVCAGVWRHYYTDNSTFCELVE